MNDRRSRIRYSVCSSERLWSDCSTTILNFKIASEGLRPALLLRSSGFVSVTLSMSARKSSHRTIFLIVSSGSPLALIASSLRSTSKKPVCPMTRSFHPPMAHCNQRVRFAATWREEFFEVPTSVRCHVAAQLHRRRNGLAHDAGVGPAAVLASWLPAARRQQAFRISVRRSRSRLVHRIAAEAQRDFLKGGPIAVGIGGKYSRQH